MRSAGFALAALVGGSSAAWAERAERGAEHTVDVPSASSAAPAPAADEPGARRVAREPHRHPPAGLGGSAVVGWVDEGWVGRLEYEALPVMAPHRVIGGLFGFGGGLEYWRAGDDAGFAVPAMIMGGVRVFPARLVVGGGINALTVDRVGGDWGAGTWGPIAMASLSLDLWGVRLGVEARASRHVNVGATDFTQLQLGISVGYTQSTEPNARPYY